MFVVNFLIVVFQDFPVRNFWSAIGKKDTFWHWEWGRISTPN